VVDICPMNVTTDISLMILVCECIVVAIGMIIIVGTGMNLILNESIIPSQLIFGSMNIHIIPLQAYCDPSNPNYPNC